MSGRDDWREPPTAEEYEEMRRWRERDHIPRRLRDIEAWITAIRADPLDLRNTPEEKPAKNGGVFVSAVTNLQNISEHIEAVRRKLMQGDLLLAQESLRALEGRIRAVNARITAPVLKVGQASLAGSKAGGDARSTVERDKVLAAELEEKLRELRRTASAKSESALIFDMAAEKNMKFDTLRKAIRRGRKAS